MSHTPPVDSKGAGNGYPDQTRNLNPTLEARVAMIVWGRTYSEQRGGSMDFWDSLSDYNKRICKLAVKAVLEHQPAPRKANK